jgi:hypothetical protein
VVFPRHRVLPGYPLRCEQRGIRYRLSGPLTPDRVRFSFHGKFSGQDIVWNMTLVTLTRVHQEQAPASQSATHRPYIEIGAATTHGRAIEVALDVPVIDAAVILRTIIMIRQYKRLRVGRHEFGEPRHFGTLS